ncbi:MAG: phenylalanine--tRNA ligase subunit beta [Candidatus Bathyarchaeota archaeon]|nr:phenylalanine--tRNA ligase subunit beta [Candidatus Bathyarchaeota archaeon]
MPTINILYKDVCRLIGRKLKLEVLEKVLPLIKCEVKSVIGDSITVEVNSDRPDMFSTEGIARAFKGFLSIEKGCPNYDVKKGNVTIKVDERVKNIRPFVVGAVVRDVKLDDEGFQQLIQLQEKLHETIGRGRRKVAIGVHNFDKIKPPITYTALPPEKIVFTPLDGDKPLTGKGILEETFQGKKYGYIIEGYSYYPILLDAKNMVLSMPPIINAEDTRVKPETRKLFLDITGWSFSAVNQALNILTTSLAERGGKIESVKVVYPKSYKQRIFWAGGLKPTRINVSLDYVNVVSGLNLNLKDAVKLAEKSRFNVRVKENKLSLTIPPYRFDILHPIDVVEDLIIAYGYDKVKPEEPKTFTTGKLLPKTLFMDKVRDLMVGFGFQEIANYVLTSKENQIYRMNLKDEDLKIVEILNPKTLEFSVVRGWLLPGLLSFLSYNTHVDYPQKIFECMDVVVFDEEAETKTRNELRVAAAICNYKVSYEDIQSVVYVLLKNLNINDWVTEETTHPSFISGRVAKIMFNGEDLAVLGEIHPKVLENFKLPNPVAAFELNLTKPLNTYLTVNKSMFY